MRRQKQFSYLYDSNILHLTIYEFLQQKKTWCYLFLLFLLFVYSMYVNDSFVCAAFFGVSAPVKTQKCDFDYEFEWCCQAAAVACEIIATQDMAE